MNSPSLVSQLSATLVDAQDMDQLVRPFLQLLQQLTGLESVYLTEVRLDAQKQDILFSLNVDEMQIPEGLSVDWSDTLCKRALEQGRPFTNDASQCWGDSEAAQNLGIRTYVSTPIHYVDGGLFGTLCGASRTVREIGVEGQNALTLFGVLIQQHVQRERLIAQLREANLLLQAQSYHDPLTDLPNRRLILKEIERLLALARREKRAIFVAFIDLDGFKGINDRYGHEVGDAFLRAVSGRLAAGVRGEDLLGRLGGDEFVFVALGGPKDGAEVEQMMALRDRLGALVQGRYEFGALSIDYQGASIGIVDANADLSAPDELLRRADAAMYEHKHARKAAAYESYTDGGGV